MSFLVELTNKLLLAGIISEPPLEESVPKYLEALKVKYDEYCETYNPKWVESCMRLAVDVYILTMSKDAFIKCLNDIISYGVPNSKATKG